MPRRGANHLSANRLGGVVEVGVDEDHLHAQLLEPVAASRALEGGVDASAGALRVGRPEDEHLGVLQRVLEEVVLLGDAEAVAEAPHVHAAPVPAFPAVGVVLPVGEAHQVHEAVVGAGAVPVDPPQVVRARRREHRRRPPLPLEADHLAGDDVQGLVPADGLVAGHPAVLGVPLAVGVEVHPLERGEDALRRVDGRPVGDGEGRQGGPARRRELAPPRLDGPRRPVAVVQLERDDAEDPAVLHVHVHRPAGGEIREPNDLLHLCLLRLPEGQAALSGQLLTTTSITAGLVPLLMTDLPSLGPM